MKNDFDPNLPIYIQVMEEIKKEIFASEYLPGSKLASVRELALEYGVNPNTIQKALSELERTGIIYSRLTGLVLFAAVTSPLQHAIIS